MSDFHDVRFPLHLAFGTRGGPVRPTDILQLANGAESDPLDNSAENYIGRGTGGQRGFELIKSYGDAPYIYMRRITKPIIGSVRAFIDDVETPVSVDYQRGTLQFETPPYLGAVITASFEFDVPVRFASDSLDIVLDDFGAAQIQDIPLIEILAADELPHG